ncbi:AzlD domain-containing protein [Maridesulfovibrio hydrothermalis]|uniref:Branched-chain amino acid transport n=1 Tax=Maridesulfovibrio hydrothermalis AM13 = DSM 14728 TaxID=1121451 RepID=L0RBD5_9BACT|nr:AzlD domain-containing protein [Maridesulfovibrio hydrothermalis]CCO23532.1 Branched-chain amino acid transport [Maridesulfovibrio hydrothermalis AM13 = DSM 14728]
MDQRLILMTLVGMMAVTYIPRMLPALALSSRDLPPVMIKWLSYVPTAVLSALLMPSLLAPEGAIDLGFDNLYLWVAIPTFAVAMLTRNFFGTVATGMGLVATARFFL